MSARALLVVGLTVLVGSGCSAPGPSGTALGSGELPGSPQSDPLQPSTIVWLAGQGIEVSDITVAVRLTLARGDGSVLWRDQIELDQTLPGGGIGFASRPSAGVFAYALTGATSATVHVVSATDPHDRVVATITEPLLSGNIDPSGNWIYLATQPEADLLRISRVSARGGEVEPVADLGPEFVPTAAMFPSDQLRWTPDGSRLLIQTCDARGGCWWEVLRAATNELMELRPVGAGTAVGVTNDTLLAHAAQCAVGPCPFVLVDLDSGEARLFDPGAHEARTALTEDGRTVILFDNQGVGGPAIVVRAYDPASGIEGVVYESDSGLGLAREGQGTFAPPGWFVVAGGGLNVGEGGIGPVLIRIADGLEVRLAAPPAT